MVLASHEITSNRLRRGIARLYRLAWPLIPPLIDETLQMWRTLGYIPNIRHPRTFNEKIAYRKLFTRERRYTELADKWTAREYVRNKIGDEYLTEVYQHVTDIRELDIYALPKSFVAKGRHDWGSTVIVDDKERHDWDVLREVFRQTLRNKFDPTLNEYWYAAIPPGLIIEERLRDEKYDVPLDFKFLVFHGKARFVQVFHDRRTRNAMRFYDVKWRPLSVGRPGQPLAPTIDRPKQLDLMIEVAETLAEGFEFVRIDLYAPNDERVVFGEFTFAPASGRRPFEPHTFDWELGSLW